MKETENIEAEQSILFPLPDNYLILDKWVQEMHPRSVNKYAIIHGRLQEREVGIFNNIDLSKILGYLIGHEFMTMEHEDMKLTKKGRKLRRKGNLNKYYNWERRDILKKEKREKLSDKLLKNNVDIAEDYSKNINRGMVVSFVSIAISLVAIGVSLCKEPQVIIKEKPTTYIQRLRDTLFVVDTSGRKPLSKSNKPPL